MPYEIAFKGIDYLMIHSLDMPEVNIGFYGGEPLLELELIQKCFDYVKSKYPGKKVAYALTTNGTLLVPEVYKTLRDNNVNILISLDGPREVHNMSRHFPDGTGSYDTIMKNISDIIEHYPEEKDNIHFNAVISPDASDKCADILFNLNDVNQYYDTTMSFMTDMGIDKKPVFSDRFIAIYNQEITKLFLHMLGRLSKGSVSNIVYSKKASLDKDYQNMGKSKVLTYGHPGGPCMAGLSRLFMTVDGSFYPCERVSENSEVMCIGNVFEGIDVERALILMNPAQSTKAQCGNCWVFRLCSSCAGKSDDNDKLNPQKRLSECHDVKHNTQEKLMNICFLKKNNYTFGLEMI